MSPGNKALKVKKKEKKKTTVKVDSTNNLTFNLRAQTRGDVTLHLAAAEEQRQQQRCDSVANASGALRTRSDTVGSLPRKKTTGGGDRRVCSVNLHTCSI